MIDVIEHLLDPVAALQKVLPWLPPGGMLIVTTGNTESLLWRLMPLDYYYYYYPEHIRFFNPRWFRWFCEQSGLERPRTKRYCHSTRAYGKRFVLERWREMARCLRYCTVRQWKHRRDLTPAHGTGTWPDHMMVVLRVPSLRGCNGRNGQSTCLQPTRSTAHWRAT
jgi:hypothetical protein